MTVWKQPAVRQLTKAERQRSIEWHIERMHDIVQQYCRTITKAWKPLSDAMELERDLMPHIEQFKHHTKEAAKCK